MAITAAKLLVEVDANVTKATTGLTNVEKSMQKVKAAGDKMTTFGKQASVGLTLPLVAAGTAAVMMASDFEEALNKVNVVFGESAGEITTFASTAATQLGMSETAALSAAGTFGNLFTAMGMGQETSADMSTSLVKLAADLASFNNIDPTEALDKLRAGLVGEAEPLRVLGVQLTEAATKAKALEMGLAGTAEALTPAMLAQARYAIILEQTTNAQGDFARTSDGLANQMRIVKAKAHDVAVEFGEVLAPYAMDAVSALSDMLTGFQNLDPAMQDAIVGAGGFIAAIGPISMILGNITKAASAVGTVLAAIGGTVAAVVTAILAVFTVATIDAGKKTETSMAAAGRAWDEFGNTVEQTGTTVQDVLDAYIATQEQIKKGWVEGSGKSADTQQMKQLADALLDASTGFGEYSQAMKDAATSQGYMIDSSGRLYQIIAGGKSVVADVEVLTQAQYDLAKAIEAVAEQAGISSGLLNGMTLAEATARVQAWELSGQLKEYAEGPAQLAQDATVDLGEAQVDLGMGLEDTQKAARDAAEAIKAMALQIGLAGELASASASFRSVINELAPETEKLTARLKYLNVEGWIPTADAVRKYAEELMKKNAKLSESEALEQAQIALLASHRAQLENVREALGENNAARQEAIAAFEEATSQMLYQAAAEDLTADAALELARTLGILSEQDYAVAIEIQNLKDSLDTNRNGMIDAGEEAKNFAAAMDDLRESIMRANTMTLDDFSKGIGEAVRAGIAQAAPSAADFNAGIGATVKAGVTSAATLAGAEFEKIKTDAEATVEAIKTTFTGEDWSGVGMAIGSGIAAGITSSTPAIKAAAITAVKAAIAAAEAAAGIHSPSQVMADEVGVPMMEGMAMGILSGSTLPIAAVQSVTQAMPEAATSYSTTVNVDAKVSSQIDMYDLAYEVARIINR